MPSFLLVVEQVRGDGGRGLVRPASPFFQSPKSIAGSVRPASLSFPFEVVLSPPCQVGRGVVELPFQIIFVDSEAPPASFHQREHRYRLVMAGEARSLVRRLFAALLQERNRPLDGGSH